MGEGVGRARCVLQRQESLLFLQPPRNLGHGGANRGSDGGRQWHIPQSSEQGQSRGLGAILLHSGVPWLEHLHALQDSFLPGGHCQLTLAEGDSPSEAQGCV